MTQPFLALALAAPWLVIVAQAWLLYRLLRGQGEIRADLLAMERTMEALALPVAPPPAQQPQAALEIGTPAPDITLPDLSGRQRSLREFLGKPLVITFFNPACSFCVSMAPHLGEVPREGARVLVISRGDPDENLRLATEHKWRCDVLLDSGTDLVSAYRIPGTPSGYLLDAEGRIDSQLLVGADALVAIVKAQPNAAHPQPNGHGDTLTAESLREKQNDAVERARRGGLPVRESTLNRQGLAPGTKAPDFNLPDLSGKMRSLASLVDRRLLLVFSDPNCGPCDALIPELVRLHDQHQANNLRVVMISRGDPQANRQKAQQHGLPFPVLLQRQWEVSKDYAMFATPVAYLIEPNGVIAKDVAVGKQAILGLV